MPGHDHARRPGSSPRSATCPRHAAPLHWAMHHALCVLHSVPRMPPTPLRHNTMTRERPAAAGAKNPFEYGRALAADELCDRAPELAKIERAAANLGKLFLIGPRRYGKTSLLHAAEERLEGRGVTVLRFDAERYETLDLLAQALLADATRVLRGPVQRARDVFLAAAKRLKPEVTYDAAGNERMGSLGLARE